MTLTGLPRGTRAVVASVWRVRFLDPKPLREGTDLCGGSVSLPALRRWLLQHPHSYDARAAVWQALIRRARLYGPAWGITATALALPASRRYAGQLRRG